MNKIKWSPVTVLASLLLVAVDICCQGTSSGYARGGAVFLSLPTSARNAALGGAMTAWRIDGAGVQYNPALLDGIQGLGGQAMVAMMPLDQNNQAATAAYRFCRHGAGQLAYRGYAVGGFEERDEIGNLGGTFAFHDNTVELALAGHWFEKLSAGIRGRYIASKLEDELAYGFGLDVGLTYQPFSWMTLGLSGLNLGSELTWSTGHTDEVLPEGRVGLFFTVLDSSLSLGMDMQNTRYQPWDGGAGLEYVLFRILVLRTGARYLRNLDVAFGAGVTYQEFCVDYSLEIPWAGLGSTHRISLSYSYIFR